MAKSVTNFNISCLDSKPVRMSSTRSAFGAGGDSSYSLVLVRALGLEW